MTDATEAQAAMLTAVASHLTNHPDVCPVNIWSDDRLQLRPISSDGSDLVEWADTLTDPRVDVQVIHSEYADALQAHVYLVGYMGEIAMTVWQVLPGLVEAMGAESFGTTRHAEITVHDLRAYARDGITPTPIGGDLAPAQ